LKNSSAFYWNIFACNTRTPYTHKHAIHFIDGTTNIFTPVFLYRFYRNNIISDTRIRHFLFVVAILKRNVDQRTIIISLLLCNYSIYYSDYWFTPDQQREENGDDNMTMIIIRWLRVNDKNTQNFAADQIKFNSSDGGSAMWCFSRHHHVLTFWKGRYLKNAFFIRTPIYPYSCNTRIYWWNEHEMIIVVLNSNLLLLLGNIISNTMKSMRILIYYYWFVV